MTNTQIQPPDDLYRRVKHFAGQRECSMAETFRRGVEQLLDVYQQCPIPADEWHPPTPRNLGWKKLSTREMHELAQEDMEKTVS